ncbi:MAG: hypothetical protein WD045_15060 [Pirellulaceae bacterium]
MRSYKENWSLFLTLSFVAATFTATGCKSMPGANYFARKDAPSASALAGEAPRYGATPASTSSPTPSNATLASRNQNAIQPNYARGMQQPQQGSNPYVAQSATASPQTGAQPQQGFYSSPASATSNGTSASNPYAAYQGGYAQNNPQQPQPSAYGVPGAASAYSGQQSMPAGYGGQASSPQGSGAAAYTASTNGGSAYTSTGNTYSYPPATNSQPPTGNYGYPQTNYPSTGSYDSTASYQATGEGSQQPHYRPGGTSDYNTSGSGTESSTPMYGENYPTSTYTR